MTDTIYYKDVKVPKQLLGVIDYMQDVGGYREELHDLGSQWDLLTILGQMSGTGMDMSGTRQGFQRLTSELLGQLGLETLKKTVQEIGSKAQVAVDIVIRNLFERTADIGFLATDDDIREFLKAATDMKHQIAVIREEGEAASVPDVTALREDHGTRVKKMVTRFQEYVAKYSVYYNIILLDTRGNVLVQLDEDNDVERSSDSLIQEALATTGDYVEVFRETDLLPSRGDALIYAYRVTETNVSSSRALGVLCLCFRFENEMEGVFKNLQSEDDWSVMTLLDREGSVIASSDSHHIPLGVTLEMDPSAEFKITRFAGREYLAKTCATKGYQGYMGAGWYGHVMVPIEHAFDKGDLAGLQQRVSQQILDAVMGDPRLFSEALRSIPIQADQIQYQLERTVWNGNVREGDQQSKVLLWNISDAGARTKMVFENSIGDLHETVVSGILNDVEFQAALAVDIMDRNLYERANDCRWWALTSAFRNILSKPEVSASDAKTVSDILAYINGLYTVYTNLFVYDENGTILAVSNPAESQVVGTVLSEAWVRDTLALEDSQHYSVSPFEASPLYGDRHTYIYGAAITDITNMHERVGGIGIVFDSEPQFREMLLDSLPRGDKGEQLGGCFGIFADRKGRIISSTNERYPVGEMLDVEPAFFSLPGGEGTSKIIAFDGYYYAVGAQTSAGYREYKVGDGYENDVIGMVFVPLAEVAEKKKSVTRRDIGVGRSRSMSGGESCMELATFYIGNRWLGVHTSQVKEAISPERITSIPGARDFLVGEVLLEGSLISVVDIRGQLGLPPGTHDASAPIVVVTVGDTCFGIAVDALGEIPEVSEGRVEYGSTDFGAEKSYVECIVKPDEGSDREDLLLVLDPVKMLEVLIHG